MAREAYSAAAAPIRSERSAEYQVFAKITQQLRSAENQGDFPSLSQALHDNRRLWTLLASDVADPGNGLPEDLRARLFYLAEFVFHHTSLVLRGEAKASVLTEVNVAVMRGLQGETGES
jgi:flagellar protein FlaF